MTSAELRLAGAMLLEAARWRQSDDVDLLATIPTPEARRALVAECRALRGQDAPSPEEECASAPANALCAVLGRWLTESAE